MPRKIIDYSKTVIYKIQHIDKDELLYVGSTTDFRRRKNRHKSDCKRGTIKLYEMIRDNGGWQMFNMVIIKEFCCENAEQARAEEDRIMREMKCNMNMIRAHTTSEEKRQQKKEYFEQNKQQKKEYDEQYYENNKEKKKEYVKEYYEQNREEINEKRKQKLICDCGCEIRKDNLQRHLRSMKHINIINN
jgi:predicted GIY-YIG superfamily endonuclease